MGDLMKFVILIERSIRRLIFSLFVPSAMMVASASLGAAPCLLTPASASAAAIQLIASSSVYVDLAEQIGGNQISASVSDRNNKTAPVIRSNGIVLCGSTPGDAWLRDAAQRPSPPAAVIAVPRGRFEDEEAAPVPWYDVDAMSGFTHALAHELTRRDPSTASRVASGLAHVDSGFQAVRKEIEKIARDYAHSDVIAADGVSRAVARRLGFNAVPHNKGRAEPTRTAIDEAIQQRGGSIFLYDRDAANPAVRELVDSAKDAGIPVVELQERMPRGLHFQQWALRQWNAVHGALNEASP